MPVVSSRSASVEEMIHGVKVCDPYRWLENRSLPETEEWIREQQRKCDTYFADAPGIDYLRSRITEYLDIDTICQPNRVGNRLFYLRRRKGQEQSSICAMDGEHGDERILIDPSNAGIFTQVMIHRIAWDGRLIAYAFRNGGSDAIAIGFVDAVTGHMLPDTIEIGYSHGLVFAPDASGVFYCQENQLASGDHTIRFHRFGETTEDPVLFRAARTQSSRLVLTGEGDHLGVTYTYERHRRSLVEMYFAVSEIAPKWHCVFAGREGPAFPYLKNGRIFLYVEREAPNGRLIELNRDGSERCVVVPEGRAKIRDIGFIGSRIYVSHYINDAVQVHSWPIEGMSNGAPGGKLVDLPGGGTIRLISQLGGHGSSLFYSYESFTEPLRFFEYLPVRRMSLPLRIAGTRIQNYGFRLRRLLYCSKDGTDIPMSLLTGSAERRSKETPVILTGYGGFGASLTPGFSVFAAITLQLGATFAFPNIRGGGEFGWEWQKAAQGRNRQTAVDDLISAAEWLCSEGITSPEHLGIVGGSNAGLMVGVAIAQRPEMFGAAVCIAPLLDMVRYEQFDRAAAKFREEYGSAKRPEEFQALFSYSPYHSVREGIDYPATLFVSGDRDDHCNPAHVRKMAARLQDRPSQNKPVIVDYSKERGHAPVLPLSIRIKALTRRIGFLCRELNMAVPGEGNHAVD